MNPRSFPTRTPAALLLAACLGLGSTAVQAQSDDSIAPRQDRSTIEWDAFSRAQGRIAINVSAGERNLQANAMAIAVGDDVTSAISVTQTIHEGDAPSQAINARAFIESDSFRRSTGAISVNQSAGELNRQSNVVTVGVTDGSLATDDLLANATAGSARSSGIAYVGRRDVSIGDGAFSNTTGIVQINQVAGVGNVAANIVSLRSWINPGAL
jgi:hypothetical protein